MVSSQLPVASELARLFIYEPDTGRLIWKYSPERDASWNARYAGRDAGVLTAKDGYWRLKLCGVTVLKHRVIWKLVTGVEPDQVDHKNGDRGDNRLANLRAANNQLNAQNRRTGANGRKGVSYDSRRNRWRAYIKMNGHQKFLGYHDSEQAARTAYAAAAAHLFGTFARST